MLSLLHPYCQYGAEGGGGRGRERCTCIACSVLGQSSALPDTAGFTCHAGAPDTQWPIVLHRECFQLWVPFLSCPRGSKGCCQN